MRVPLDVKIKTWLPTEIQASILEYLSDRQRGGQGTTREQIAKRFGFATRAGASYHLAKLNQIGLLHWRAGDCAAFEVATGVLVLGTVE